MSAALDDRPPDFVADEADPLIDERDIAAETPVTPEQAHARAVDSLALGAYGLAKGLGAVCPPHTAPESDGLKIYGDANGGWTPLYALWLHWRNAQRVRETWDALQGVRPAPLSPPLALPQPDEAPGLDLPDDPAGPAEKQPRFVGIG